MKVLIIGGEGQLGTCIGEAIIKESFADFEITTLDTLDLSSEENIKKYFANTEFNYVINCSAYTAVDKAESDYNTARQINALAPQWIGKYSRAKNAGVIHISTDYVFDGSANTPLKPQMQTNPISAYGKTKLEGEQLLREENSESIIIRTSWLYSPHGQNFVKTMLRLGKERSELNVVYDQIGTPTSAIDLSATIIEILRQTKEDKSNFKPGVYHYSNEGVCSWYDFAYMIFQLTNTKCNVKPVTSDAFPTVAQRPAYSVMDKSEIKTKFNITIPHWIDSLKECLNLME